MSALAREVTLRVIKVAVSEIAYWLVLISALVEELEAVGKSRSRGVRSTVLMGALCIVAFESILSVMES